MKKLLKISSIMEIAAGLALAVVPSIVLPLLLGLEDSEAEKILGRFSGIALLCLGLACWPAKDRNDKSIVTAAIAMIIYNFLVAVYFTYLKISTQLSGLLLIPVVVLHFVIAICFVYLLRKQLAVSS